MSHINNNTELNIITDLAVAKYTELLAVHTDKLLDAVLHDHKENRDEYKLIIESLQENQAMYYKVVVFTIKNIMLSCVKEVPRTVLISQVAETMVKYFNNASNRFRIASAIVKLLELSELFSTYQKTNTHGFSEAIVTLRTKVSTVAQEDLKLKIRNLPKQEVVVPSTRTAGHSKKISADNSHMMDIVTKLSATSFMIDERVWNKFKYQLVSYRFTDLKTQEAMLQAGDSLLGKELYFGHRFGDDNGRVYCDGDLFTLHGGALNYIYKFTTKEVLTDEGMKALHAKVDELMSEDTLSFKEQVELYSLSMDLIDAQKGLPVGTILHIDAKLSGLQHQAIATRDLDSAQYCGLLDTVKDGYGHIKGMLSNGASLTRQMVKDAYNPYQYGAGRDSTLEPVLVAGGSLDFKEWETAYKSAFPKAFELRSFLLSLCKNYKAETYTFTSPSGFNCTVTGLGNVKTAITTCYGKLEYSRSEIDKEFMGVKLLAAFSHMLDSSALHHVVRSADFDMHCIHDSFGSHPNYTAAVHHSYTVALQNHLCSNILQDFVSSIVDSELVAVNVNRLMSNTLRPSHIVGGLY